MTAGVATSEQPSMIPPVTRSVQIASGVQIAGAVLLLVLLGLEWVRGGRTGLEGNGGGGFGVLTLITALVVLYAAVQGLRGRRMPTRLVGPNQLGAVLAVSLFFSNLVFLWVFSTGGAPKWVYVGANAIAYASVLGMFATRAEIPAPLPDRTVRALGGLTALLGVAVAAAPALDYTALSSITFTGYEPGAPRIGILFLLVGGFTTFYGFHRLLLGNRFGDLGPFTLLPHATLGFGVMATAPALAWLISGLWGPDFDPGIGVWLNLVVGIGLIGVGAYEGLRRGAQGV